MKMRACMLAFAVAWVAPGFPAWGSAGWRAGLAEADITPGEAIRLEGYAARVKPSEGVASRLRAKALALDWDGGEPVLLVTADVIGFTGTLTERIWKGIGERTGLKPEQVLLVPSHTHAGPMLAAQDRPATFPEEQWAVSARYTDRLVAQLAEIAAAALAGRSPALLSWGSGKAGFVMNRRERTERGIKLGVNPAGHRDESVPVLRIDAAGAGGGMRAVLFGCACHNTTMGGDNLQIDGEYAGHAQAQIERAHPGVKAMFLIGCAGDANPHPRGTIELAREHGLALAAEVSRVAAGKLRAVLGPMRHAFDHVDLPLAPPPPRERLEEMVKGASYLAGNARRLLALADAGQKPPTAYRAPVAVWRFGSDLTLVALPGEVVSEYVPLLRAALGEGPLWICGYANDDFGYVPTRKIIAEGGYETRGLFHTAGFFDPAVEEALVGAVRELVGRAAIR